MDKLVQKVTWNLPNSPSQQLYMYGEASVEANQAMQEPLEKLYQYENQPDMKMYAYEIWEGDKGIIIAKSFDEAEKIFHEEYPERKIVDNESDWWNGGAYLEEMDYVENNKLYCCFPW